jgi:hypothetical protein
MILIPRYGLQREAEICLELDGFFCSIANKGLRQFLPVLKIFRPTIPLKDAAN